MKQKVLRAGIASLLALASGLAGYGLGTGNIAGQAAAVAIPVQTVLPPEKGTTRIIYSLDQKRNEKEIIALIDSAKTRIYFAIYTFTLPEIADALITAKKRGVEVRGIMDSKQSSNSYGAPVTAKLRAAGIPIATEKHASGTGIMHIKAIVTESAYAIGSYNWTKSATTVNDEILEVGTDPALRQAYENILKRLFDAYASNAVPLQSGTAPVYGEVERAVSIGTIDYTDAPDHIGEQASVRGTLQSVYTSKSGTVFLDFCKNYKTCPFAGVIFADDAKAFSDLSRYIRQTVTLTGKISLYQGGAEIILSNPSQISP